MLLQLCLVTLHQLCPQFRTWLAHSILPSPLPFHTSEVPGEDGLLSPILDTGATHCLLPLAGSLLLRQPLQKEFI